MIANLAFDPYIDIIWVALLAGLALVVSLFYVWRLGATGLLRAAAVAALLGLVANPQWQEDDRTALPTNVLVISDVSASQSLGDRPATTQMIRERMVRSLDQTDTLEIIERTLKGDQETRALEAVQAFIADTPRAQLGGVFLITDGQASDIVLDDVERPAVTEAIRQLLPENVPFHVLLTGHPDEFDRKITLTEAPRYGIVRESVRVAFRIDDLGSDDRVLGDPQNVEVVLRLDGEEILREVVPTQADVGFDVPLERPGDTVIELSVAAQPGELTDQNNTVVLPITAVRDRLRVLLISGEPNPGERVWRNLLKSDPSIDMVHFTILRTIGQDRFDPSLPNELALIPFPTDPLFIEKLREFDLVIFDRYTWRNVLKSYHFDNVARFVEEGGAMLVASGPEFNGVLSLANRRTISFLLPVEPLRGTIEMPYRPLVTDAGKRHPVTADLPEQAYWGRWLRVVPTAVRDGTILLEGPQATPLLVLSRTGEGRVATIQSDHIWLWARGFDGGGPHAELLRRTAHWLMKEPQLEEESLTLAAQENTLVIRRRTMAETPEPVVLNGPDGTEQTVKLSEQAPGLFVAELADMPPGLYRATSDDLFAIGAVGLAGAPEYEDVVQESRKLAPLAVATGGRLYPVRPRDADRLSLPAVRLVRNAARAGSLSGPGWAGIAAREASIIEGRSLSPLLPNWVWLGLIAAFLAAAWGLESRGGRDLAGVPDAA